MPATTDVPVVIQVGKWRRVITVPLVPECTDTAVATGMTRLPKNKTEGDMPRMALATGEADALECMLRKIGIDESEITNSAGTGRVHLFQGAGGTGQFDAARGGATFTGAATTLCRRRGQALGLRRGVPVVRGRGQPYGWQDDRGQGGDARVR